MMIAYECYRYDAHRSTLGNGEGCLGAVCRLLWWFNGQGGLDVRPHLMRGHLLTATVRCRGGEAYLGHGGVVREEEGQRMLPWEERNPASTKK